MNFAPVEVTQSYYQHVLDAACQETAKAIDNALAELPDGVERIDTIGFFHHDDPDVDATELEHTSYDMGEDTFDRNGACEQMRAAGEQASEHVVVCCMLSTTMYDGMGGHHARIYAASAFERRLHVLDGTLQRNGAGRIVGVRWQWDRLRRKAWGKGQPFIAAFFDGLEAGIAKRN